MLSIVIPAYNEEESIRDTLLDVVDMAQRITLLTEVIIVDDGSKDGTSRIVQETLSELELNQSIPESISISLISHHSNRGYGAALKSGITKAKHSYIGILDADASYGADSLFTFYKEIKEFSPGGMIVGQRVGKFYKGSFSKRILRKILRVVVEYMTGREIPDINSGARVFDRDLALARLKLLNDKFSFTSSITLVFMLEGREVIYKKIPYNKRIGKSKVKILRDSIRTLGFITAVCTYYSPMRVFFPIVILSLFAGVLLLSISSAFGLSLNLAGFVLLLTGALILVFAIALQAVILNIRNLDRH